MRHPARVRHNEERSFHQRCVDIVTKFAGSIVFLYIHALWFTVWVLLPVEPYPYGLLTMIVSLEAIFLSTFVLITQNRDAKKYNAVIDHDHAVDCEVHAMVTKMYNQTVAK